MKKFFKIGVLLLFMIGLFTVQLNFKPLVDDDVGIKSADNYNFFSNDDVFLTETLENPRQVMSPLKYPCYSYQTIITKVETKVCLITLNSQEIYNNNIYMANQTFTNGFKKELTNLSENKLTGKANKI